LSFSAAALGLYQSSALAVVNFSDDFDSYSNVDDSGVFGAGWSVAIDTPNSAAQELLSQWTITNPGARGNPSSIDGSFTTGNFMVADSDFSPGEDIPGQQVSYNLMSPAFSTVGNSTPSLHVDVSANMNNNGGVVFMIESSSDSGTTWDRLYTAAGPGRVDFLSQGVTPPVDEFVDNTNADGFRGRLDLDLPISAANNANVQVRFRQYEPNNDWWIGIDNVVVDDVPRLTTGGTVVFSEDFNTQDGTLGGMSNLAVNVSTTSGGFEQFGTNDNTGALAGLPLYVPGIINTELQTGLFFPDGGGVNRIGHPTPKVDLGGGEQIVPFALAAGIASTSGQLGPIVGFESVLHTPVLDLTGLSEVFFEYDSESHTTDLKNRVVLREVGVDGVIDANDTVVDVIYDYNLVNPTGGPGADHDVDGIVAGSDFLIQQRNFGGAGTHATGDTNSDGVVNTVDTDAFQAQFGGTQDLVETAPGGNPLGEDPAFAERIFSVPAAVGRDDVYFAFEYGSDVSLIGSLFWAIDNVKVSGTTIPALAGAVPEPSALLLVLLGGMACVASRRRHQ